MAKAGKAMASTTAATVSNVFFICRSAHVTCDDHHDTRPSDQVIRKGRRAPDLDKTASRKNKLFTARGQVDMFWPE
jgi:hypothetical protein